MVGQHKPTILAPPGEPEPSLLKLPDTDKALDLATPPPGDGLDDVVRDSVVRQQVTWPTPWLDQPQQSNTIAYTHTASGWRAAELKDPAAAITPDNFTTLTRAPINLSAPVLLETVAIAKPWGQELWFSGIEQRGESTICQGTSRLPLSSYLALAPQRLVGRLTPMLLKILDPHPTPETGALYFETHNKKREVYVVTHINPVAWPEGIGAIRLGMNQQLRATYNNDEQFRAAYLEAVQRYEQVRRSIDHPSTTNDDPKLHNEEQARRADMEAFTAQHSLEVGDVVQVAPHTPHSLQHGVRVFEFQTPTYERNIISFNQQVLTQDHWDSSYAITNMTLDEPVVAPPETLHKTSTQQVERIVDFDEFSVQRLTLAGSARSEVPTASAPGEFLLDDTNNYQMIAIISGKLRVHTQAGSLELSANSTQSAALIPACALDAKIVPLSAKTQLLLARPKPDVPAKIAVTQSI